MKTNINKDIFLSLVKKNKQKTIRRNKIRIIFRPLIRIINYIKLKL